MIKYSINVDGFRLPAEDFESEELNPFQVRNIVYSVANKLNINPAGVTLVRLS